MLWPGTLRLDAPVEEYCPEFADHRSSTAPTLPFVAPEVHQVYVDVETALYDAL